MRPAPLIAMTFGLATLMGTATVACAQDAVRMSDPFAGGPAERPTTMSDLLVQLERDGSVAAFDAPITDIEPRWVAAVSRVDRAEPRAVAERVVWFAGGGFNDRLRLRTEGNLRRADGAPVPPGPQDRAGWDTEHYDVSYVRVWPRVSVQPRT